MPNDLLTTGGATLLREAPENAQDVPQMTAGIVRQIPDEIWEKIKDPFTMWMRDQIYLAQGERAAFVAKIARWRAAYDAPLPDQPKHFPIWNASNLPVPVIKEIVNTLSSQIVQMTLTARPYWIFEDLAPEWEPYIDDLQDFMDVAAERDLDIDEWAVPWITEMCKLGTGVAEIGHDVDVREVYEYTSDGMSVYPKEFVYHDGPAGSHIPLEMWWIRLFETDHQKSRWCGKEIRFSKQQLEEGLAQGKFIKEGVDKVLKMEPGTDEHKTVTTAEKAEEAVPVTREHYKAIEIWCSYDINGKGRYAELKMIWSLDAECFISRQFNPYWHGQRPFLKIGYSPVEHRYYDEGLCEMLEALQDGIRTKNNQRSDNATLASLRMVIKRKSLRNIRPGDPWYSGKMLEVSDIWNDIRDFQMAEIYPSTVNEEQILRGYAERLSGVNEATFGNAMPVTRTTAFAQAALLQEQARRVDLTVRGIRKAMNKAGQFTMSLYFQFGTNGKGIAWFGSKGRIIEAIFRLSKRVTDLGLGIRANVPTSALNKQSQMEGSLSVFNLLMQMYEKVMPFAQFLAPDSLPEVANAMVKSAHKYMGDVLETFGDSDPEGVLQGLTVLERVLPSSRDFGGMDSFEREQERSQVLDGLQRLEDLAREAEAHKDGFDRVGPSDRGPRRNVAPEGVPEGGRANMLFGGESLFMGAGGEPGAEGG